MVIEPTTLIGPRLRLFAVKYASVKSTVTEAWLSTRLLATIAATAIPFAPVIAPALDAVALVTSAVSMASLRASTDISPLAVTGVFRIQAFAPTASSPPRIVPKIASKVLNNRLLGA